MDKFKVKQVSLRMLPNDGWVAQEHLGSGSMGVIPEEFGAFSRKADLMAWLRDNLSYSNDQSEDIQSTMKQEG